MFRSAAPQSAWWHAGRYGHAGRGAKDLAAAFSLLPARACTCEQELRHYVRWVAVVTRAAPVGSP